MNSQDTSVIAAAVQAFVNTGTPREAIDLLRTRAAALLTDEALGLLDTVAVRHHGDTEALAILDLRRRAIVAARTAGIAAGVAELYRVDPVLQEAVSALINAPGYADMLRQLRTTPLLLTDAAAECLDVLATWNAGNPGAVQMIGVARALVEIARTEDVDAARVWMLTQLLETVQREAGIGPESVSAWENALALADPERERDTHAEIQINLGQAYRARNGAGDLDRARGCLESAAAVLTRDRHPVHFAGIQRILGNSWFGDDRVAADVWAARALEHYRLAIEGIPVERDPANFLHVNFMMASCCQQMRRADDARTYLRNGLDAVGRANLAQAIDSCAELAEVMAGGGPETAAALHTALAQLSARLEQLPADHDPGERARFHFKLGNVYRDLFGTWRAEYLERAIAHTDAASKIWTRAGDPDRWAQTQHNLGAAYGKRVEGERSNNIELAIALYDAALTVHTRHQYPESWALTHNALGTAWLERVSGDPERNADVAVRILEEAAAVWEPDRDPFHWGECYNALGAGFLRLASRDGAAAIDRAIECFTAAAVAHTRDRFRSRWTQLQNNLANAYLERNGEGDVTRAIGCLRDAVAATDRDSESYLWGMLKRNEGAALSRLDGPARAAQFDAAVAALQDALSVYGADVYPAEHRDTQAAIGLLWFSNKAWTEALAAYRHAIAAAERVFSRAYTETGRLNEAEELSTIYRNAAYCLVKLGEPDEALHLHERGKTRVLTDAIELSQARFERLAEPERRAAAEARNEIADIEDRMRRPAGPGRPPDAELGRLLAQARQRLAQAIGPAAPVDALHSARLRDLIPQSGALVVLLLTSEGGAALVAPHGTATLASEHVVPLDAGLNDANALLLGTHEQPGLMRSYAEYLNRRAGGDREGQRRAFNRYQAHIERTCRALWPALMGPIFDRLEALRLDAGAPVLIVPHGSLALLPLHAARAGRESPLLRFSVQYAPSLGVLAQTRARLAGGRPATELLAVADPGGDLEFAAVECAEIARLFGPPRSRIVRGPAATAGAVVSGLSGCSHLHFSCHGSYGWRDPLRSGLLLADGRVLDVAELMSPRVDLDATRLVVLSACETGLSEWARYPDEFVGLNAGLLLAGAPAVVSSLWAVEDRSTSLLMSEFYRRLVSGESPAVALSGAQRWLSQLSLPALLTWVLERKTIFEAESRDRPALAPIVRALDEWAASLAEDNDPDVRPYEHPYYWSAFTALGAA